MGLGAAKAAQDAGAAVVIAGTSQEKAERIASGSGPEVTGRFVDVTKPESIRILISGLESLDHLFFTAAPAKSGAFRELRIEDARRYLEGHFWGS